MAKVTNKTGAEIAAELVADTMEWFDADNAKPMVNECIALNRELVQSIAKDKLDEVKPKDKAQMASYLGKVADGTARLVQFSAGKPDQRTEISIASLLNHCTEAELAVFDQVIARIEATGAGEKSVLH